MYQENSTLIDYLRHGEPTGGSRFRGNGVDDPLSDTGWAQMRAASDGIDGWQAIVSSPMRRCRAFAEWLAAERGLTLTIDAELREVGFGSWEGKDRTQLRQQRAAEYDAFYADPVNNRPPGAEPLHDFGQRVATVFERLCREHLGQHLLVVAHAGVIRATLGHVIQAPPQRWYSADVAYAGVTRFAADQRGTWLVAHNWRPTL